MLEQFKIHIEQNFPFLLQHKVLVAVSGGIDSMVLTHMCHQLNMHIGIAHCNFKLREAASDEDALFVGSFAKKLQLSFHEIAFNTEKYANTEKISIQMAARKLRYEWFNELTALHDYDYIVTAHHLDDSLETFLINFLRGTGLQGLTGIPVKNGKIVRPLLPFTRDAIVAYTKDNNITWREDESNAQTKYLRNNIRHEVIPKLKTLNPELYQSFSKTQSYLQGSQKIVDQVVTKLSNELISLEDNGVKKINIERLKENDLSEVYLVELLKPYGFTAWEDIATLVNAQSGKQVHSETHRLIKDRAYLLLETKTPEISEAKVYHIFQRTTKIETPIHLEFETTNHFDFNNENQVYIDKDVLKFPLQLRKWKKGDYFYPLGMMGKKKLSKFFKDEKMSIIDKEAQWLLCAEHQIVWIVGKRLDNRFRITEQSKNILKITYKPKHK